MKVIDPGHLFELRHLDGEGVALLRFVKRIGRNYPGNEAPAYEGTTIQEVLRAIISRCRYVNDQLPCAETEAATGLLEAALLLFEIRAKRVKGNTLDAVHLSDAVDGLGCPRCGHVMCVEDHGAVEDQPK